MNTSATGITLKIIMLLFRFCNRFGQDITDVLVRLNAIIESHACDSIGHGRRSTSSTRVQHLLLLHEELLLLLLEHSLL